MEAMSPRKFVSSFYDKKGFPGNKLELEVILRKELGSAITASNSKKALALSRQFMNDKARCTAGRPVICPRCGTCMEYVKLSTLDTSNAVYCPKDRVIFPVL